MLGTVANKQKPPGSTVTSLVISTYTTSYITTAEVTTTAGGTSAVDLSECRDLLTTL